MKKIGETDMMSSKAKAAMESGDLAKAQDLYCDYLVTLDKYLVPPYQVIFPCTALKTKRIPIKV